MGKMRFILVLLVTIAVPGVASFAAMPNIEMVFVKGGCYQMGDTFGDGASDEKPVHKVCVNDFYLGTFDVTQAQWQAVMGKNPSNFSACGPDCPVESVSWNDAQDFIKALSELTGKKYRLPYEAEWEYAARSGGRKEKWAGTSDASRLGEYAWFDKNSKGKTHVVGAKKPNGLGIYDMSGNVWEWMQDRYGAVYYGESPIDNPQGPATGPSRVMRGGSWYRSAGFVRAASRYNFEPSGSGSHVGFRLVVPGIQ